MPSSTKIFPAIVFLLVIISSLTLFIYPKIIYDLLILVIESERVRREVIINAKEQMEKTNVDIIGVVLNKQRYHIPNWIYNRV